MEDSKDNIPNLEVAFTNYDYSIKNFKSGLFNKIKQLRDASKPQLQIQFLKSLQIAKTNTQISIKQTLKLFKTLASVLSKQKKEKAVKELYLDLALQYFSPFVSFHYNKNEEPFYYYNFSQCLKIVPNDLLIQKCQAISAEGSSNQRTFNILLYTLIQRNQVQSFQETIIEKLREEYLIDSKKRVFTGFKFTPLLKNFFSQEQFFDVIMPSLIKLLRRTEQNVDTFRQVMECDLPYDFSKVAEDLLLNMFKDLYISTTVGTVDHIIVAANNIFRKIKDHKVQKAILNGYSYLIEMTIDDQKKCPMLQLLEGPIQILKQIEKKEEQDEIAQLIIQIIYDNLNVIKLEPQFQIIEKMISKLFQSVSNKFCLSSQARQALVEKVSQNSDNKWGEIIACRITSYLLINYLSINEDAETFVKDASQITELVDAIYENIFLQNLKDSKKLVTNSFYFLASFEVVTLGLSFNLGEIKDNLSSSFQQLFSQDLFTNTRAFLSKAQQLEMNSIFISHIILTLNYSLDSDDELKPYTFTIGNNIIQSYINSGTNCANSKFLKIFYQQQIKKQEKQSNLVEITQLLSLSLYNYLFFIQPKEIENLFNLQQYRQITQIMVNNFITLKESINNIDKMLWVVYHPFTGSKIQNIFFNNLIKNEQLRKSSIDILTQSAMNNPYVLISEFCIENQKKIIAQASLGFTKSIIELELFSSFDLFQIFLIKENYQNITSINDFIEQKQKKEKEYFENEIVTTLHEYEKFGYKGVEFLNFQLEAQQFEEKKVNQSQGGSVISSKKGTGKQVGKKQQQQQQQQVLTQQQSHHNEEKAMILDEEEMKAKWLAEHKANMFYYYLQVSQIISLFSQSKNKAVQKFFFETFFNGLIDICNETKFQNVVHKNISQICKNMDSVFSNHADGLAELAIKMSEHNIPSDKNMLKFEKFQEIILQHLTICFKNENQISENQLQQQQQQQQLKGQTDQQQRNNIEDYKIQFVYKLQKHVLSSEGFDQSIKQKSIQFFLLLAQMQKFDKQTISIYEDFIHNINILSQLQNSNILIEILLKKIDASKISGLLYNILNYLVEARKLVLKALTKCGKSLDYSPTFEEFIKFKILQLDEDQEIVCLTEDVLRQFQIEITVERIKAFNLTNFLKENSRESFDKFNILCKNDIFAKQQDCVKLLYDKIIEAGIILYNEKYSEEGLLFFPNFIMLNIDYINQDILQPIYTQLIERFCNQNMQLLMDQSLKAGIEITKRYGQKYANQIVTILEKFLKSSDNAVDENQISSIIFLGVIAPHIKNKSSIEGVSKKILNLFMKGSESLQRSLSKCLQELMNFFDDPIQLITTSLKNIVTQNQNDPIYKKGCAYLIAGLTRGLGVQYLESLKIFQFIDEAMDPKKDKSYKESSLFLLIALLDNFGRVIEPFIVKIMQVIMFFFGDQYQEIRDLALQAAKIIMSRLTGYGVKIVLPHLLKGLEDQSWRAKFNNIWALGNMAFCSPKQLSSCLPQIVPKLSQALSDTHPKIREIANQSLTLIGSSIKNPEIAEVVDLLIQALSNPFEKNIKGLEVLLQTRFVHYIDAPSLALVIPIIDYALKQKRESEAKIHACQVVGSISTVIKDQKDIIPYMNILIEGLQLSLGDALSEVRQFAARAIGKLSEKIGSENSQKFFKFIWDTLENEQVNAIERGGAAQGMSEILNGLGLEYFESQLPRIFEKILEKRPFVREGYVGIFVFLPVIMKNSFEPYIKEILENISEYVSDDDERTREITLRVLRILIQNYGASNAEMLMGPINDGFFSYNWQKRNSAIILSGEMLEVLNKSLQEDQQDQTKRDLFNINYMSIYILRSDELEQIRNNATNIWKNYIENTPRTLKQALPMLNDRLIFAIIRDDPIDQIAKISIKNFCSKYGESFFPQFLEDINNKLKISENDFSKLKGILLVISEYMRNLSGQFLSKYQDDIVSLIKHHMFTKDQHFRKALFQCFKVFTDKMDKINDKPMLNQIVYNSYQEIKKLPESSEYYDIYMHIFEEFCNSKSAKIIQFLIPLLFETPMLQCQIEIITNNSVILGKEMYNKSFQASFTSGIQILFQQAFILALQKEEEQKRTSIQYALEQLSIQLSENDLILFLQFILESIKNFTNKLEEEQQSESNLIMLLEVLRFYFYNTVLRVPELNQQIVEFLIPFLFMEQKTKIIEITNAILISLFGIVNKEIHFSLMPIVALCFSNRLNEVYEKQQKQNMNQEKIENQKYLIPSFNQGQEDGEGIKPYIDMLITCIVYGQEKLFDSAIEMFNIILDCTLQKNLQIYTMKLAGPLIRVVNYRLPQETKEKLLMLFNKLHKQELYLKPFCSQLQTTYIKIVQEFPREKQLLKLVSECLNQLMVIIPRKDVVLHEVYQKFKDDVNLVNKEAYLYIIIQYLKYDLKKKGGLFAKALIEKIFECSVKIDPKDNFNNNILFSLSKLIGLASNYISHNKLDNYQKEVRSVVKESYDEKYAFFSLSNLFQIHFYFLQPNQILNSLDKIKEVIFAQSKNFEKDWIDHIVHLVIKLRNKKDEVGQFYEKNIPIDIFCGQQQQEVNQQN